MNLLKKKIFFSSFIFPIDKNDIINNLNIMNITYDIFI